MRSLLAYVRAQGGDAASLARSFGMTLEEVASAQSLDDEPQCSISTIQQLGHTAADLLRDPMLGVHLAATVERGSYGVVDFITASAPTVREAFRHMIRYQRLINTAVMFSVEERPDAVVLEHRIPGEPLGIGRHGNEYTIAMLVRRCRELCRTPVTPRRVWFAHASCPDLARLAEAVGTESIAFASGCNGIAFEPEFLETPIPGADAALLRVLESLAEPLVASTPAATDLKERVKHELRQRLQSGDLDIAAVAAAMAMSARTLQRRLHGLGTSFNAVCDEVRRSQALAHVDRREPKLALSEIAFLVGYSDVRAFLRAFKRWTGMSPQQYRARQST